MRRPRSRGATSPPPLAGRRPPSGSPRRGSTTGAQSGYSVDRRRSAATAPSRCPISCSRSSETGARSTSSCSRTAWEPDQLPDLLSRPLEASLRGRRTRPPAHDPLPAPLLRLDAPGAWSAHLCRVPTAGPRVDPGDCRRVRAPHPRHGACWCCGVRGDPREWSWRTHSLTPKPPSWRLLGRGLHAALVVLVKVLSHFCGAVVESVALHVGVELR